MVDMAQPNVAVIGCGYWGKNLVRNFQQLGALAMVADVTEAGRAAAVAVAGGAPIVADIYEALRSDVAGVVISTPAETHFELAQRALEAGKDTPKAMAAWLKELKGMPGLSGNLGFNAKGDRVGEFYRTYKVDATGNFVLQPK